MRKTILMSVLPIIISLIFCIFSAAGEIKYFDAAGNNVSESEWNEIVKYREKVAQQENYSNYVNSNSSNNDNNGSISNNQNKIIKSKRNPSAVNKRGSNSVPNQTVANKSSYDHVAKEVYARSIEGKTSEQSLGSARALPQIDKAMSLPASEKANAPINQVQSGDFGFLWLIGAFTFALIVICSLMRKGSPSQEEHDLVEGIGPRSREKTAPNDISLTPQVTTNNVRTNVGKSTVITDEHKSESEKKFLKTRKDLITESKKLDVNTPVIIIEQSEHQPYGIKRCRGCDCPAVSGSDYCYSCG